MNFTFQPMDEAAARQIMAWRYEEPYTVYNWEDEDEPLEMLDTRSPHFAVYDETGELVGFFAYGSSAYVWDSGEPQLYDEDRSITIGLGMRPDLTGKGLGLAFVNAGLDYARQHFAPASFRLYVMPFNERAIQVYERAGFERTGMYMQHHAGGARAFVEMKRPA